MSWLKDPFKRFLNIYGALVIIGVLLLLFTREAISLWAVENSAIPLLEAEASYLAQEWEEEGELLDYSDFQQQQDVLFSYQFKELVTTEQLEVLENWSDSDVDAQASVIELLDFDFSTQAENSIGIDTYLPVGDKWQRVLISMDYAFFSQQMRFIDWLIYAVIAIMLLGFLAASFMTSSIKRRLTDINSASRKIRQANDLTLRIPSDNLSGPLYSTISEINGMLEGLQVSTENTRQQANNIAHDLRTPLTALYQRVQLLSQADPELEELEQMTERLLNTFNTLLKINRLESNGEYIELSAYSLADIIEDAVDLYAPVIEDYGQSLSLDLAVTQPVLLNQELMFQVLCNLLDNACKFNQAQGEIAIQTQETPNEVTLSICDQSGGVGEGELSRLCDKFYRSDKSRNSEGNGLGLSLVSAAVVKMGGKLVFTDTKLNNKLGLNISVIFPKVNRPN